MRRLLSFLYLTSSILALNIAAVTYSTDDTFSTVAYGGFAVVFLLLAVYILPPKEVA